MKKFLVGFAVAAITVGSMSFISSALASMNQFTGTWYNIDSNTRGITKLSLSGNPNNLNIHTWGKCHPNDCDWGTEKAFAYADNVSSNLSSTANTVSTVYNTSFSQKTVILKPAGHNKIKAEVLTRFTDNSNRTNFKQVYTLEKRLFSIMLPAPTQISPTNDTVFNHYPRTTNLRWQPVSGAASYAVEVDCLHCCTSGSWCTDVGKTHILETGLSATSYSFNFVGAQPGRWRVWAIDSNGRAGKKSGWFNFRYTR